jgi:hypothetical protein
MGAMAERVPDAGSCAPVMPGTENAMQSSDDFLRKALEAFGERGAENRRTAISTIWETYTP